MTLEMLIRPRPADGTARTECGRPGCAGWFGYIYQVVAVPGRLGRGWDLERGRVHLIERNWKLLPQKASDDLVWEIRTARRKPFRARAVPTTPVTGDEPWAVAVEPEALLRCPRCSAVQRLPEGVADPLDDELIQHRIEVGLSRVRRLDWKPST